VSRYGFEHDGFYAEAPDVATHDRAVRDSRGLGGTAADAAGMEV